MEYVEGARRIKEDYMLLQAMTTDRIGKRKRGNQSAISGSQHICTLGVTEDK